MLREFEFTAETVEEAVKAACEELGKAESELTVTVLQEPVRRLFKHLPAVVKVAFEEAEAEPAAEEAAAEAEAPAAEAETVAAAENGEEIEVPINLDENEKARAAAEYLREVVTLMGAENVEITAVQKGEATILKLEGDHVSVLIGRRGETMESLSYLTSLVANHLGGDYMKLGLDVSGYRGKREKDLAVLAQRLGNRVIANNRAYEMEPMNPYERRLIHSAIGKMEGVRSESKGEGNDRHVVIYSTAEGADNEHPEKERRSGNRGGAPRRKGDGAPRRREGGNRSSGRGSFNGNRRNGGSSYGSKGKDFGGRRGPKPSAVPERSFKQVDADKATPVAAKRTERVDDFADFNFGKIEF